MEVRFTDNVAAQDPDIPADHIGVLVCHNTSETATWEVNGKERITLTFPELSALIEAATKKDEP